MFEEVTYISCVLDGKISTFYFYHKTSRTLIPVKMDENQTSLRLREVHSNLPTPISTLKKIVYAVGADIQSIKVYLFQDSVFYTYITVKSGSGDIEVNAGFLESMILAEELKTKILFEKNIIKECGIKITKKMIEKSLVA